MALGAGQDTGVAGDGVTALHVLTVGGTALPDSTVTLYDGTSAIGQTVPGVGGAWTITTPSLSQGTHALTSKVTSQGVDSAASPVLVVVVDTVAPGAPAILGLTVASDTGISAFDRVTADTTPTVTGIADSDSVVTLYDTDGVTVLGTSAVGAYSMWSITSAALADGPHRLVARSTDLAGNVSPASATLDVVIESAAPPPVIAGLAPGNDSGASASDGITSVIAPVLQGSAGAGDIVTLYDTDGTTILGSGRADQTGQWSVLTRVLEDGRHLVTARTTDAAGNVSAASSSFALTIDSAIAVPALLGLAPGSDTGASASDGVTGLATPTLHGTAEAGSVVTLFDGPALLGVATADQRGQWRLTPANALAAGVHMITATATDAAGNVASAAQAPFALTIDLAAPSPTVQLLDGRGGQAVGRVALGAMLRGTGQAGDTIVLAQGGTSLGSVTVDPSGAWSFDARHLAGGTVTAAETDLAGHTGTAALAVNLVTVSPTASGAAPLAWRSDQVAALTSAGGTLNAAAGTGVIQLIDGELSVGPATDEAFIARLYGAELGRTPGTQEVGAWMEAMPAAGHVQVAQAVLGSAEYAATHGVVSDAEFVAGLYHSVLGREADGAGQAMWTALLQSGASRAAVLSGFAESGEAQQAWSSVTGAGLFWADKDAGLVRAAYQTAFGRDAETAGLQGWMAALKQGLTPQDFASAVAGSPEFQANHAGQSTAALVGSLYQTGLGRAAEPAGLAAWSQAIDSGGLSVAGLVLGISTSPEAQARVAWAL